MASNGKALIWMDGEIKHPPFSKEAQSEAGRLLRRLQLGESLSMPHSRPMPSIERGCHELRVRDEQASWRIVYYIHGDIAIVVLAVFAKKTEQTPLAVISSCKRLLKIYKGE